MKTPIILVKINGWRKKWFDLAVALFFASDGAILTAISPVALIQYASNPPARNLFLETLAIGIIVLGSGTYWSKSEWKKMHPK